MLSDNDEEKKFYRAKSNFFRRRIWATKKFLAIENKLHKAINSFCYALCICNCVCVCVYLSSCILSNRVKESEKQLFQHSINLWMMMTIDEKRVHSQHHQKNPQPYIPSVHLPIPSSQQSIHLSDDLV